MMVDPLEDSFPNISGSGYTQTSDYDPSYNCIAWAAERDASAAEWWWPGPPEDGYTWPATVARAETVDCFLAAFATLGYQRCEHGRLEAGWQKLALYAREGVPTHMARQLPDGRWTSKLGRDVDITHSTTDALEDTVRRESDYGKVVCYLRRPTPAKQVVGGQT